MKAIIVASIGSFAILFLGGCVSGDWQNALKTNTREGYQSFIAQHPESSQANTAKLRLENLDLGIEAGDVWLVEFLGGTTSDLKATLEKGWLPVDKNESQILYSSGIIITLRTGNPSIAHNTEKSLTKTAKWKDGREEIVASHFTDLSYNRSKNYLYFRNVTIGNNNFDKRCLFDNLWYKPRVGGGCVRGQQSTDLGGSTQATAEIIRLDRATVSSVKPDKWTDNDYGLNIKLTDYGYTLIRQSRQTTALMIGEKEIDRLPPHMPIDREGFLWHPGGGQTLPAPLTNPMTLDQAKSLCDEIMIKSNAHSLEINDLKNSSPKNSVDSQSLDSSVLVGSKWLAVEENPKGWLYGFNFQAGGVLGVMPWKRGFKFEPDVLEFWKNDPTKNTSGNRWEINGRKVDIYYLNLHIWGQLEGDEIHCEALGATGNKWNLVLRRQTKGTVRANDSHNTLSSHAATGLADGGDGTATNSPTTVAAQRGRSSYALDIQVQFTSEIAQGQNRIMVELRQGLPGTSSVFDTKYFEGQTATVYFSQMPAGSYFVAIGNGDSVAVGPVHAFGNGQSLRSTIRVTYSSGNVGTRSRSSL